MLRTAVTSLLWTGWLASASSIAAWPPSVVWAPLGSPHTHTTVQAAALDVCAGQGQSPLAPAPGQLALAVGYVNPITGGSSIGIDVWEAGPGAWNRSLTHTPQFAQDYSSFKFRCRMGLQYVGLYIGDDEDLASVLRGEGGYDGMEGCYAFSMGEGLGFDFEIDDAVCACGDMRLLNSPDNATLNLVTYNHTGWSTYPAGDAFGPSVSVPVPSGTLDDVSVVRGPGTALYGVYTAGASINVVQFSLGNDSTVTPVGSPLTGACVGASYGFGVLCISSVEAAGVRARCLDVSTPGASWSDLGIAAPGTVPVSASCTSTLAITAAGLLFVGAQTTNTTQAAVALCPLNVASGAVSCVSAWAAAAVPVQGDAQSIALTYNAVTDDVLATTVSTLGALDAVWVARALLS